MPKTKTQTPQDLLRRYAGQVTGARYQDAIEVVNDLEDCKTKAEDAAEQLNQLDEIVSNLDQIVESVEGLVEYRLAPQSFLDSLSEAKAMLEEANGIVSVSDVQDFTEAWEAAQQSLETYEQTKEGDSYPGKRDELQDAWSDATASMEALADALDSAEMAASEDDQDPI